MSAENPILEFLDNDHDNGGLDACYCIKGQPREYGRVDVMDGGAVTARVLLAVNNHDQLLEALKACYERLASHDDQSVPEMLLAEAAIARADRAEAAITWVFANGHVVAQDFTSGNRDVYEIRTPEELEKAMRPDLNRIEAERLDKENKAVADWVAAINTQTTKETT